MNLNQPVCGPCWNWFNKPELEVEPTGPMDGPHPSRQAEGAHTEECSVCGKATIMGLYLKARPVPPRMWVRIGGSNIGIGIDTDPTKGYWANVRVCLFAAEKLRHTCALSEVGAHMHDREAAVGEIMGHEGVYPL